MKNLICSVILSVSATMAPASTAEIIADAGQLYFPGDGGKPPRTVVSFQFAENLRS